VPLLASDEPVLVIPDTGRRRQMDWIGDKLTMLIEEGKKALGREVVVMSDAKEDEVDEGTESWEEENPTHPSDLSPSRHASLRHAKTPHALPISSPSHSHPHPSTPTTRSPPLAYSPSSRTVRSDYNRPAGLLISPPRTTRGVSLDSDARSSPGKWEDESAWTSPELRESMEKARARVFGSWDREM
jgi:hypothetical protein